ncbi:MAG: CvpA family protein [Acutalibacteraceae bacterium]|nr:CvpA family protein [Acutalibacteraceae bacterium]
MNNFDLIMVAVILILSIVGFARGAVKTIISVVGGVLSYVLSYTLGKRLAEPVYNYFFKESVEKKISLQVTDLLENGNGNIGDSITESLPAPLQFFANDTDLIDSLNNVVGETNAQVVESATHIIQQVAEPIFISLVSILVTIVLFMAFSAVVSLILHLSNVIDKIPVVSKANRIVGAILGFMSGLVLTFATVFIFTQFSPFISNESKFNNNVQETSLFFKIFADDESTAYIANEYFATELSTEGE